MKCFGMRHLITILCTSGALIASQEILAAGFQLWEQDGASIANYHAGYAALATDASISFYNPAGITRIKNQQLVVGAAIIPTDFKYKGYVTVVEAPFTETFPNITAQGGVFNVVPNIHYVAPITDCLGFGFSIVVPFGLKTSYGRSTALRYAATLTSIQVIDYTPSLAWKVTDKASIGAGLDIQHLKAEFDNIGMVIIIPGSDTSADNEVSDTAYGFHLGALYEFSPSTRAGLSYHSQVVHHLSGTSTFSGPVAEALNDGTIRSNNLKGRLTLPPYIALSAYHKANPFVAVMGSVIYTKWNTFEALNFSGIAGAVAVPPPDLIAPSNNITVNIPEHYRNTWNVSFGVDYYPMATDDIILRGGIGYDQSPVRDTFRNVQLPDTDRYILAMGGHYQAFKCVGFDIGWSHIFTNSVTVNPPPQVLGGQTTITNGRVKGGADVFGLQVTWDIDKPHSVMI